MKYWYHGESFKLFPNLEIWYDEEKTLYSFTFVWMKFAIDLPIYIKCKKNEKQKEK